MSDYRKISISTITDKPRNAYMQNGMAWLTLKHAPPHVCYHAEFGRSTSKDVGISRENPKTWGVRGPADWSGAWLIPTAVTMSNCFTIFDMFHAVDVPHCYKYCCFYFAKINQL